jgi:hypothetical protein
MTTYIEATVARFAEFDLSCGVPFRELVGCLLWITLCVLGSELLRVKDLARRSNSYTSKDYQDGLKVLKRISERKLHGIVIYRNAATRELLPAFRRPSPGDPSLIADDTGDFLPYVVPDDDELDILRIVLPVNRRYRLIAFGDASFAIGELK